MNKTLLRSAEADDASAIARIQSESWRDSYRGLVPDAILDGGLFEQRLGLWRQRLREPASGRMVLVIEDEAGEPRGFVSAGPNRSAPKRPIAEIYALYVEQNWRGGRMGTRLLSAAATRLNLFGYPSTVIWTLSGNQKARSFYSALGGRVLGSRREFFAGADLEETAYAWATNERLIKACAESLKIRQR